MKLPTWLSTLLNRSGRSQATVNAQMPPELMPQMARPAASWPEFHRLAHLGQDLLLQEAGILVGERVVLEAAVADRPSALAGWPGTCRG